MAPAVAAAAVVGGALLIDVVICGSEAGSTPVVEALAAAGCTALAHVAGGFAAWRAAGSATTPPTADQA